MAIKTSIYNQTGDNIGEIELSEKVFAVKVNESLVHQAMITQQANERQVLAHTKIRSEVRGGGKKPWRQKGTGRARAGSSRSPIWIGGGVTFGPRKDRNFSIKINRKMKQAALLMVLSDRLLNRNLAILDNIETAEFKTKIINNILHNFENKIFAPAVPDVKAAAPAEKKPAKKSGAKSPKPKPARRSILLINDKADEKIKFSARNLADVKFLNIDNLNILDLLRYRNFIITKEAAVKLADRYSK